MSRRVRAGILRVLPWAGVVKLADARDSKSRGVHSPCRFDSDLRHQPSLSMQAKVVRRSAKREGGLSLSIPRASARHASNLPQKRVGLIAAAARLQLVGGDPHQRRLDFDRYGQRPLILVPGVLGAARLLLVLGTPRQRRAIDGQRARARARQTACPDGRSGSAPRRWPHAPGSRENLPIRNTAAEYQRTPARVARHPTWSKQQQAFSRTLPARHTPSSSRTPVAEAAAADGRHQGAESNVAGPREGRAGTARLQKVGPRRTRSHRERCGSPFPPARDQGCPRWQRKA